MDYLPELLAVSKSAMVEPRTTTTVSRTATAPKIIKEHSTEADLSKISSEMPQISRMDAVATLAAQNLQMDWPMAMLHSYWTRIGSEAVIVADSLVRAYSDELLGHCYYRNLHSKWCKYLS
jgi:hypothetical protein